MQAGGHGFKSRLLHQNVGQVANLSGGIEEGGQVSNLSHRIKFADGPNQITLASDGDKVRGNYGAAVEFRTKDGKILSVKPSPMLGVLADAKKRYGTLVGRTLHVFRSGTGKENTKYSDVRVV